VVSLEVLMTLKEFRIKYGYKSPKLMIEELIRRYGKNDDLTLSLKIMADELESVLKD
jgi:hypothetical protein